MRMRIMRPTMLKKPKVKTQPHPHATFPTSTKLTPVHPNLVLLLLALVPPRLQSDKLTCLL
jgi:hypothetical protein